MLQTGVGQNMEQVNDMYLFMYVWVVYDYIYIYIYILWQGQESKQSTYKHCPKHLWLW
jgi:hypothetical protein